MGACNPISWPFHASFFFLFFFRYVGLLSGQLESQRVYFADMMAQTERAAKERYEYIEQQSRAAEAEAAELRLRHDAVHGELTTATSELDAATATFKAEMSSVLAEKMRTKTLMAAQTEWQAKIQQSEVRVPEAGVALPRPTSHPAGDLNGRGEAREKASLA